MRIDELITPTPPSAPSTISGSGSGSELIAHTHTEGVDSEAASLLLHFTRGEGNEVAREASCSSSSSFSKGLGSDGGREGSPLRPAPFPIEGIVSYDRLQLPSSSTRPATVEGNRDGASATAVKTWAGPARNRSRSGGTYSPTPTTITTNLNVIRGRSVSYKDKDKFPSDTSTSPNPRNLVGRNNDNSSSGGIPSSPHIAHAPIATPLPSPLPLLDNPHTAARLGLSAPTLQSHLQPPQDSPIVESHTSTSTSGPRHRTRLEAEGSVPVRPSDAGLSDRAGSDSSSGRKGRGSSSAAAGPSQTRIQNPTQTSTSTSIPIPTPITTPGSSSRAPGTQSQSRSRVQVQVPVQTQGTSPDHLALTRTAPGPNPNPDLGDRASASGNLIRAEMIEPEPARPTFTTISTSIPASTPASTTISTSTSTLTPTSTDAEQRRLEYLVWKFGRDMQDTDKETAASRRPILISIFRRLVIQSSLEMIEPLVYSKLELPNRCYVQCGQCRTDESGYSFEMLVHHPFRDEMDDWSQCLAHILSDRHCARVEQHRLETGIQGVHGDPIRMEGVRVEAVRPDAPQPAEPTLKRPREGEEQEDGKRKKRIVKPPDALGFVVTSEQDENADGDADEDVDEGLLRLGFHTSEAAREYIKTRFDMTQADLEQDDLVRGYAAMVVAEQSTKGSFDKIPDLGAIPWDGDAMRIADALTVLGLDSEDMPISGMKWPLTSQQLTAAASIWKLADEPYKETRGFLLCDSVGMGKTCTALTIFMKDIGETGSVRPTLILCPSGIQADVWKAEIEKHVPQLAEKSTCITKGGDWGTLRTDWTKFPIVILSYELLQSFGSTTATLSQSGKDLVTHNEDGSQPVNINLSEFIAYRIIADEFQHMRNPRTRLAKVATSYADEEHIKHVLLLSGTPNPTSMLDLWTPLRLINSLKSDKAFGPWAKQRRKSPKSQSEVMHRLLKHPFYMSRHFDFYEWLRSRGLGQSKTHIVLCSPGQDESAIAFYLLKCLSEFENRREEKSLPTQKIPEDSPTMKILTGMRELSFSFQAFKAWFDANQSLVKLHGDKIGKHLRNALDEVALSAKITSVSQEIFSALGANADSKILVVGQDDAFNGPLQDHLEELGIRSWEATSTTQPDTSMIIYDSNSKDRHTKSELLTRFATDKRIRVMMGPITPLSEGKNLQMCDHLFILDTPRSKAALMQITGRLMRRGQERPVVIKRFTTTGGPDEIYNRMLDESIPMGDLPAVKVDSAHLRKWLSDKLGRRGARGKPKSRPR
ncbi:hypothetical protein FFLO_07048 [Filobasidium floriforme]|uniref:Helicase ATP-binding domain-containing protein n=1 Tax=Filobasidium floriforme TaxID=5210 RepID=A0A8K0JE78_9TREE|nr:P-loop containing nucleoside triphosphate hydrolase protein [Filobasidium floriforme]KAG7527324.1 hypothetical protein FFLO_07048 [Filobasidium floriforme]KAH8077665.1 P-loop containing nucleoside triphosphate hydrolase protein [Filobasidium floriforme]